MSKLQELLKKKLAQNGTASIVSETKSNDTGTTEVAARGTNILAQVSNVSSNDIPNSSNSGNNESNNTELERVENKSLSESNATTELATRTDDNISSEASYIKMQLADLKQKLDANIPDFVNVLSVVHKKLLADPTCVTILSEEEIHCIVRGLLKHTQTVIVAPKQVKEAKKLAKNKVVGVGDI